MPKYGPYFNKNVFGCVKCSIYDLKNSISLIFEGLQTPHFTNIFEEIFGKKIMPSYVNQSACYVLGNVCDTCRIPFARLTIALEVFNPNSRESCNGNRRVDIV
jgi:hypothetical protein